MCVTEVEVAGFAICVLSTEGKVQWFRIRLPTSPPPPPPRAVCLGAYGKHQREVENMASQAKGKNVQVRTFLFTGHGVLCHCFGFSRESGSTLCRSLFIGREED